jgi:hypothetical protein
MLKPVLAVSLVVVQLSLSSPAMADNINTATATAATQAEACNSAMNMASIPASGQVVTEKKCSCVQEEKAGNAKWSCFASVSYSFREYSAPVYNGVNVPTKGK